MRTLFAAFAAAALAFATPAIASPPVHPEPAHADGGHAEDKGHGEAGAHADQAHGDERHGGGEHGDHHALPQQPGAPCAPYTEDPKHLYYTLDADCDGTQNWMDSDSEGYVLSSLGFHFFNLVVYIAILFAFVRRPLLDALRARALEIRKGLTDSYRERDEAKERHDEVDARLQALADEIAAMKAEAAEDAKEEQKRLIERAHEEAERIGENAERSIRDEVARARTELRRDAVELAVELAEGVLRERVTKDDQQRLARQFLTTLKDGASADV